MSLQRIDPRAQVDDHRDELADQPRSPWLNTTQAAAYLCYTGKHPLLSVYKFIERHGIVVRRDGRRLLLARADVDRALNGTHARESVACARRSLLTSQKER